MKKRIMLCALCLLLGLMMLCSGCEKKESADDYLGRLITRAKENEGELQSVLEMGIADAKSSNDFVIDFPDELKESYEAFLKEALNQVQFELNKADKESDDTYIIRVTYEPIDIAATTKETDATYVKNISGTDLTTEVKNLLEEDTKLLSNATKQQKKSRTITVKKSGDSYKVSEKDITALLQDALQGYMAPYEAVGTVFDFRDFMQAYLDAYFKGDTERYCMHTGESAEEAATWYEESFNSFRLDDLTDDQNTRFINAIKAIYKNCQYTLGAMRQVSLTEYQFDLTATPNTSIVNAASELDAGTYYSTAEVADAFLNIYDKYAAMPSYGTETTVTINWNSLNMASNNASADENFNRLVETIIPSE